MQSGVATELKLFEQEKAFAKCYGDLAFELSSELPHLHGLVLFEAVAVSSAKRLNWLSLRF